MIYPFDVSFTNAPPADMFLTYGTLSWVHNSATGTIDITASGSVTAGLILKSTPPESKLTFGAEVMFTGNTGSSDLNHFGFWLRNYPEIENYQGFRAENKYIKTKLPYTNQWYFASVNSGVSAFDNTSTGRIAGRDGFPEFTANTWYDVKVEYAREELPPFAGAAYMRLFVNGVYAGDLKHIGPQSLPVTPGFFLSSGNMKVRRMYGNITPEITIPTPSFKAVHDRGSVTPTNGAPVIFTESTDEGVRDTYGNTFVNVKGRVLDESFQPLRAVVYALSSSRNTFVADTISDQDGFYELIDLRTEDMCTITVFHNGKLENVKKADYTGFGTLSGIYRIRGVAAANVHVRVFSEETGEYLGQVDTDANGGFTIPNVNKDHQFNLVFREPSGAWEDRVSSRRIPELAAFNLQFTSSLAVEGDSITGSLKVNNGYEPYTVTAENLKPGVRLIVEGNEITFADETTMQGPYSIPITVKSIDGGEGVFVAEGVAGYPRADFATGSAMSSVLEAQIDRDDPYFFTNTKTILRFDSDISDTSPARMLWWAGGTTSIDTTNKKFGAGSLKFTGGGSITTSGRVGGGLQLGTGDFTLEGWIWIDPSAVSVTREIFTSYTSSSAYSTFYYQGSSNALQVWKSSTGVLTSNTTIVPPSQWIHVAFSRKAGTCRIFQNGTQVSSFASTHDFTEDYFCIGGQATNSSTEAFIGNMDDIRITVGVGRYTANFVPPTKAFTNNK